MALKRKISAEAWEKLPDALQSEYEKKGEDYVLSLEGDEGGEDVSALKRAKDHEKTKRIEAEKKLKELQAKEEEENEGKLKSSGDLEALEKSYKEKMAKREGEMTAKLEARETQIRKILVDNVAERLAKEISVSPSLLIPHIKARLAVEFGEEGASTRVLDADGKPSASTLDDFKGELLSNKEFSPILIGSKASGGAGGAAPPATSIQGSGAPPSKPLSQLSKSDFVAQIRQKVESETA